MNANLRSPRLVLAVMTLTLTLGVQPLMPRSVRAASGPQVQPAASESAVRETLQRYSTALESLDANAVKKVQPSIPVENLAKAFKEMRELKVTIESIKVLSSDGTTARVSCRVTQTLTPKAGAKQTSAVVRVMKLRRAGDAWVIDSFER